MDTEWRRFCVGFPYALKNTKVALYIYFSSF